jgi:hypothetical protein
MIWFAAISGQPAANSAEDENFLALLNPPRSGCVECRTAGGESAARQIAPG